MSPTENIENILIQLASFSECSKTLVTLASASGLLILLYNAIYIVLQLFRVVRLYVLSQCCFKTDYVKRYGKWAVISGATDGIGQAMARELVLRGMSVVLVGRNAEKLTKTKAMLEQVPNAGQVETVKIDLADSSPANFERIRAKLDLDGRDIGLLVNAAGLGPSNFLPFDSFLPDQMVSVVNVNVLGTVQLTRMILPAMIDSGRGLIVNVSSLAGSSPWAYLGVYAPTKAFVNSFTRQLQREYRSHPIDIVLLHTGPVYTKLSDPHGTQRPRWSMPTPEAYAKSVFDALPRGGGELSGMLRHDLVMLAASVMRKLGLTCLMERLMLRAGNKTRSTRE